MEENKRLRRLVNHSETTPVEADLDVRLPGGHPQKGQEPPLPNSFTWELPEAQILEEVQLDGLTIRDLFEQYASRPIVTVEAYWANQLQFCSSLFQSPSHFGLGTVYRFYQNRKPSAFLDDNSHCV